MNTNVSYLVHMYIDSYLNLIRWLLYKLLMPMSSLASSIAKSIILDLGTDSLKPFIEYLSKLFPIMRINLDLINRIFRKALRLGAWTMLKASERAMLMALRRYLASGGVIVSRNVIEIVKRIYAEIEIHSLRGRAILVGIITCLRRNIDPLSRGEEELLVEGLQYINRPVPYRTL
jgi:hypothetical protein